MFEEINLLKAGSYIQSSQNSNRFINEYQDTLSIIDANC